MLFRLTERWVMFLKGLKDKTENQQINGWFWAPCILSDSCQWHVVKAALSAPRVICRLNLIRQFRVCKWQVVLKWTITKKQSTPHICHLRLDSVPPISLPEALVKASGRHFPPCCFVRLNTAASCHGCRCTAASRLTRFTRRQEFVSDLRLMPRTFPIRPFLFSTFKVSGADKRRALPQQ